MKTEKQYRKAIGGALLNKRQAMAEDGLKVTQEDIAEQAGISTRYYGNIERGNATPSIYTCARIAEALQMTLPTFIELIENY